MAEPPGYLYRRDIQKEIAWLTSGGISRQVSVPAAKRQHTQIQTVVCHSCKLNLHFFNSIVLIQAKT